METFEILSWIATVLSLAYVILAARSSIWCWVFAGIGCAIWAYVSYESLLYSDAGLQLFYMGMAVVGWINWNRKTSRDEELLPIKRMSLQEHLLVWVVGLPLGYALGRYLGEEWGAVATYWDAYTTVFSVIITFAVINRRLENWLYWIAIDIVTGLLYYSRELYAFALVMLAYTVVAVIGYVSWKKEMEVHELQIAKTD
ncbi:MAG: nicotinamide riboside transporter PnuC [Bacteroidota bacterium]